MVWQDVKQKVLRFAVLKHVRAVDIHWDLLLQIPDRELLATWQIRLNPQQWGGISGPVAAVQLPDHRMIYLEYEGEISGGRGNVTRVDCGKMELVRLDDQRIHFILHGQLVRGTFTIHRVASDVAGQPAQWLLEAQAA